LNSTERLTKPMLKQGGQWLEVEWQVALEYVANGLRQIKTGAGAEHIGALATGNSTLEEMYLLQKLVRGVGSNNVDFRLHQADFSADGKQAGAPWLGMTVAELNQADRFLLLGSFLRKDHPLLAARIRQAVKSGAQANVVHSTDDELLMKVENRAIVVPSEMVSTMAQVLQALAAEKKAAVDASVQPLLQGVTASATAQAMAKSLACGERSVILLGNYAQQHPQAAQLQLLAQNIAALSNAKFGFLGEAANSVGGYLAQAVPSAAGMNAAAMLAQPRKAYLLLNVEAELDTQNSQQAIAAMHAADMVVCLSAYKHQGTEYADVMLPISPFTETSGTFVNTEGRVQSFKGAVKPQGEARPAWKVLRVLGNLLKVQGFDYDSSEAVRDAVLNGVNVAGKLNNTLQGLAVQAAPAAGGLQRVADVPIYATDAIVRRSAPLQATQDAATPFAVMHSEEMKKLGVQSGDQVKISVGQGSAKLKVAADDKLPKGVVRVAAGHAATAGLGAMFGAITVERA
jgi:NADH-quinone oxidoreductase subunit G